jgi:hypothetical protein
VTISILTPIAVMFRCHSSSYWRSSALGDVPRFSTSGRPSGMSRQPSLSRSM